MFPKLNSKNLWGLFVFVEYPEVPSDNNAAERAIRPLVVRKVSGGSRSPMGSKMVAILLSLFGIWQARGEDLMDECQQMLLGRRDPVPD
jgi:transposase